ncbi:uncharacterized protein LOC106139127 isoform X1 [Amyelois transitella]|uniref:uncharacterized protein LOC106139127 isoform X1 n=1 Tax=Amyelois transitella TaxID=680683 RepID=UPI0029902DF4|nr:uncharacterized protein LOC106139127 isoform X1 [Amyelois transitella]
MERQQCNSLQNFDDPKTEILKKRLLKSASGSVTTNLSQYSSQHNVLLNTLRAPISSSMIVSSVQAPQSSMPITHNLVTHSIAPMKIHANNAGYPLLSTVHVPVQIPGSNSNINVPVQLSGPTSSVPLQIAPVSLPLQVSGTTNVPVQLPAGETINVPLQLPGSQNIQLAAPSLPSMPILQNTSQPLHSSIIHVHMGTNPRPTNMDGTSDMTVSSSTQLQMPDSSVQVKLNNQTTVSQVQVGPSPAVVQIPNSNNNSIQLALPNTVSSGAVQLRGATRTVPHMVYIQTPTGLKPVTSTEVISQASTSGNPPQIIVRRPVNNSSNIVISKPNIAPKVQTNKSSILAPVNPTQPIVIQKPKSNDKMMVPVSIAPGNQGKQAIAYLGSVKKPANKNTENQSILISNNQTNVSSNNQKLFLTPMNMPKIQNTKFILPVTLPASKGPFINLQIANGQIQNDPQGSITVMRDSASMEGSDMPPLQPLPKINANGKDSSVPQSPKNDKAFTFSISGSRAEPTGAIGEYTLSIPETNSAMNEDVYTVSIADDDCGQTREQSFTLSIPEKGKSLLNRSLHDRDVAPGTIPAPAILRRSNSDNSEKKTANANIKRRISLCNENLNSKTVKLTMPSRKAEKHEESDNNDDHRVPSLFCDEKLDKDLETKDNMDDSDTEDYKDVKSETMDNNDHDAYYQKGDLKKENSYLKEMSDGISEEDPPGLLWSNGVAVLQGSNLQFQTNEFGIIDLIENSDQEELLVNPSAKYQTPLKQRAERNNTNKKRTSPEDMYRCDGCGCHGMAAEFITPNFCSSACQSDVQKAIQKRKVIEKAEMTKKKNRLKKIFMKKHLSESDMFWDSKEDKLMLRHYDSTPADTQTDEVKMEDLIVNEKYPWMCGKNGFSWMRYLDICKAKAVPCKVFKDPFPNPNRNGFKVGMRLEAIDPQHPSIFCVVSVAEVQGYRMRLHFDGYPDLYDYWVNADSIDIFPPGWCEKNGRSLKPPANYTASSFSWPMYLKQIRAIAAPKALFSHITNTVFKPNCFRVGMKLEAEDRKNDLVCVATVTDVMEGRLLINFDSWDEMYDFWADPTSPYIHPVGWAEENGYSLTPPNFYKDPEQFSWESYLSETGSAPAPPRAFKPRAPNGFKAGMKLEVVDPRVPFLIRVATISEIKGHQLRVTFDGWPDDLSTWMDDDSPDLHPVGWCLKTGHPLEPPLTEEELQICGPCGVGGCRGLGSARGGAHKQHAAASSCPYYTRRAPPPDRLQPADALRRAIPKPMKSHSIHTSTPTSDSAKEKPQRGRPPKHKRVEKVTKNDPTSDDESLSSGGWKRHRASPRPGGARAASRREEGSPPRGAHVARLVSELALAADPTLWSENDVVALVGRIAGAAAGRGARAARLAGAELLMASCEELVTGLRLRLGPAVKIYSAVRQLRETAT